jgi:hypothetical protein
MEDSKKSDKARKIKPRSLFIPSGAAAEESNGSALLRMSGKHKQSAKLWDEVLDGHIGFGGLEERWEVRHLNCVVVPCRALCPECSHHLVWFDSACKTRRWSRRPC